MAEQLARRQSHRLQGLPLDSPRVVEGEEGVLVEILSSVENCMELTPPREYFTVYTNPLVQLPPTTDASLHTPLEGHDDVSAPPDYGLEAPFWRTSMGQSIAEFGVVRPSFEKPPMNEDSYRIIQESLSHACNC